MPRTSVAGVEFDVDEEGFLTDPRQWTDDLGDALATAIGIPMTDEHRAIVQFLRHDFDQHGETPTLRRVSKVTGVPVKRLFELFPKKPAKKMAFVAGLPKPTGCV
jgi:tRNA 2-thiouridine synthesizing protein E